MKPDKNGLINGRNPARIPAHWETGSTAWRECLEMLLPEGFTCGDCHHAERCRVLFGGNDQNRSCQFHPRRFHHRQPVTEG